MRSTRRPRMRMTIDPRPRTRRIPRGLNHLSPRSLAVLAGSRRRTLEHHRRLREEGGRSKCQGRKCQTGDVGPLSSPFRKGGPPRSCARDPPLAPRMAGFDLCPPAPRHPTVRSHPQASSRFFPVWQDDFEVVRMTCAPSLATNHLSGACRWDSWPWVLTC